MRKIFIGAFILVSVLMVLGATPRKREQPRLDRLYPGSVGTELHITSHDTVTTANSWRLVSRRTFTIMPRADTLRVISSSGSDSVYVTLFGVSATDSGNTFETLRLSGTDSVYGTKKFLFLESAILDTIHVGIITIASKTGGTLTRILQDDDSQTQTALHYTGRLGGGLTRWFAEIDTLNTVELELRFYPFMHDVLNLPSSNISSAHVTLDRTRLRGLQERTHDFAPLRDMGAPMKLDRMGAIAVFSQGTVSTNIIQNYMDVYDKSK